MKKDLLKFAMIALIAMVSFTSCDDDEDTGGTPTPTVEDGFYIKGAGTGLTDLISTGRMKVTKNEVLQEDRAALLEMYIAVKAGTDGFNIVEVAGATTTVYGPGTDFAEITGEALNVDEPKEGLWKGSYAETATAFTVPADALYHVVIDTELKKVAVAKVVWGMIGGATPGGWGESTPMPATFDLNKMTFEVSEILMLENEWKFRYSNGWKIILDTEYDLGGGNKGVKVNTNFGGAIDALVAGGGNIANAEYAIYKGTLTWELGKATVGSLVYVKPGEPLPEYPENLYMIGASIGGWDWAANGIQMVPAHSNPHLFWKIVWIEKGVADAGIKFAPGLEWVGDFGVNEADGATNGVWNKGTNNVPDVHETGYYMVVVNLVDNTIEINSPMVYGIGDAFGGWDAATPAYMFTVNNTDGVLVSPALAAAANVRMHVAAATLTNKDGNAIDWWQAEFNVIDSKIEYRGTGGDQAAVPGTVGQIVTLNFKDETGTIQ